jgi:hypothetical protein
MSSEQDEGVLGDLKRDLWELEQRYQMASDDFFWRWKAGELTDSADYTDWSALYQMVREIEAEHG